MRLLYRAPGMRATGKWDQFRGIYHIESNPCNLKNRMSTMAHGFTA